MDKSLQELRKNINMVDKQIMDLFVQRLNIVKDICTIKEQHNISIEDKSREQDLLEYLYNSLINKEYSNETKELFLSIITISKNFQKRIIKNDN